MSFRTFFRNIRGLGRDEVVTRSDFTLDHAPDWVFEVMATGVPIAGGVSSAMDVPGINRPADNVLMVSACIMARRNAISRVPFRLSDSEGNIVESGLLYEVLKRPNQGMSWSEYVAVLETYRTLYNFVSVGLVGENDKLVEKDEPPTELVPLNPANIYPIMGTHQPTGTPMIVSYRYADQYTGSVIMYEPHQVLIQRGFNPHAPLACLAPLTILRRTMQGDIAARELNLAMLQNNAIPAGVLENPQTMTKDQAEEVLNFWNAKMQGYAKRGRVAALWGGLKYNPVGLSPEEMQYLDGLKFLRTDYYMIFRIPPEMVYESMPVKMGTGNEQKESAKIQWWEDEGLSALQGLADLHLPVIQAYGANGGGNNKRPMTRSERISHGAWASRKADAGPKTDIDFWFDENQIPCLVQHRLAKLGQAKSILDMGYAPDDVNDYLDLGLPEHPDNLPRVPSNLQLLSQPAVKTPEPPPALPASPIARIEHLLEQQCVVRSETAKQHQVFVAERTAKAAKKWSRFFVEQRERVLARFQERAGLSTRADASTLDPMMAKIFPRSEEDPALVARLSPLWAEHMKDGWDNLRKAIGGKTNPFAVDDPRIREALKAREIQGLKVNDTTESALRDIFSESIDAGDTMAMMADKIAEYYAANCVGADKVRPETAARTQTSGLVNDGRLLVAREVGGLKKYWIHGSPAEPRPSHVEAAQRYDESSPIDLDTPFEIDGEEMDAPGDASASPENTCNCTCMAGFILAGNTEAT